MAEMKKETKLAKETIDALNVFGFDEKAYAEEICRSHKTLQQSWMRMVVETCRLMAQGSYDLRNEAAHKIAEEIVKIADENPLPFI